MMDIKKLAAGVIAGGAITVAFAAPASAATDASHFGHADTHSRVTEAAGNAHVLVDNANSHVLVNSSSQAGHVAASHADAAATPCGGGINCR